MPQKKRIKAPVFETLAVLDPTRKTGDANVTIPRTEAVQDAKDWVEENEK